jgi:hypothetical protein
LIAEPITFSRRREDQSEDVNNKYDTNTTVEQVLAHDLKYERLCVVKAPALDRKGDHVAEGEKHQH